MSVIIPEFREIKMEELPLVSNFPPVEWNLNLEFVYGIHFNQPYFYAAVAIVDNVIAGTGMAIMNKTVAWLGTIIVKENYRNKGIGNAITKHLIDTAQCKGAETVLLTASDMGKPIYERLGFKTDINYVFFKPNEIVPIKDGDQCIRKIDKADYDEICELDFTTSGEDRSELLINNAFDGIKYDDHGIKGFYLPSFGKGLIVASDNISGIELLKSKITTEKSSVCVPETNINAINYLLSAGYNQFSKIPRMFLGENVEWKPECIFSRGSGYMG
ncbi:MAG TPA: GNAT family N-acetyltransferase [Bacteroidales bacterium]|nr:GNAT family N-acetyltransferase [Bacteroidales bacterium]